MAHQVPPPLEVRFVLERGLLDMLTVVLLAFSGFGHDKSQAILPYRQLAKPPTLFFFGDGVSGA